MVFIIDPNPQESETRKTTCKNCAVLLQYVRNDIHSKRYSVMGEIDTCYYIICPNCKKETNVNKF